MFNARVYIFGVVFSVVACGCLHGAEIVAPLTVSNPLQPTSDPKENIIPTRNPPPEYYRCSSQTCHGGIFTPIHPAHPEFRVHFRGSHLDGAHARDRERFLKRPSAPHDRIDSSASGSFISSPGSNRYPPLPPPTTDYGRDRVGGSAVAGNGYGGYGYGTSGGGFLGAGGGGIYDSVRGPYGPPNVMDYPGFGTGFDSGMDYGHSGYGFFNQPSSHHFSAKSLFLPLAGAALLGVAAALVANPVLLQLGVISGKRRKRSIEDDHAHKLAYRKQIRR
ncbi:integral component of membrane [Sergentomyia squamirostris]